MIDGVEPPDGFDTDAVERLIGMDGHFWSRGRVRLVERLLDRIPVPGAHAVELGCGTGLMLGVLESRFAKVTGVDGHLPLLDRAGRRSATARLLRADVSATGLPDATADLVMALDVLEHVPPQGVLAEARRIVTQDGMLLVSVPASPALWSPMDVAAGHRCRYTRRSLAGELGRHGWRPVGWTHYQCLLYPLVWLSARLGWRHGNGIERQPQRWLEGILGAINRAELVLFGGISLPFGSSLFMWARPDAVGSR